MSPEMRGERGLNSEATAIRRHPRDNLKQHGAPISKSARASSNSHHADLEIGAPGEGGAFNQHYKTVRLLPHRRVFTDGRDGC